MRIIIILLAMAVTAQGQTKSNICDMGFFTNAYEISYTWNFVADAKHLTKEEEKYYNSRANLIEQLARRGMSYQSLDALGHEVKLLDLLRDFQIATSNAMKRLDIINQRITDIERKIEALKVREHLQPIGYSNIVLTLEYAKVIGYLTSKENTNLYWGVKTQQTNHPSALQHCVIYGIGTNVRFRLWSQEVLPRPKGDEWQFHDNKSYEYGTWVTE